MIGSIWAWLTTASHWSGADGIWQRTLEHLEYTAIAVVIAAVIALPIGAMIGHTGRGTGVVAGVANALRALPSLGLLVMLALWALGRLPVAIALQAASIAVTPDQLRRVEARTGVSNVLGYQTEEVEHLYAAE